MHKSWDARHLVDGSWGPKNTVGGQGSWGGLCNRDI